MHTRALPLSVSPPTSPSNHRHPFLPPPDSSCSSTWRDDMAEDCYSSSPEVSSSCAAARMKAVDADDGRGEGEDAAEEELELGLSLGAKKNARDGGGVRTAARPWRESCRILTAKDFPSMVSTSFSPNSSSASSSFSFAGRARDSSSVSGCGSAAPSQVVGWPPIRSCRMHNLFQQPKNSTRVAALNAQGKNKLAANTRQVSSRNSNAQDVVASRDQETKLNKARSRFVKVNMDGVPIGRKVDLNAHQSYETLALVLEDMFQSPSALKTPLQSIKVSKLLDGSSEFVLTYEDKDGDWMLVGDVPWGMFLSSVRRLRIMKTSDTTGLDR